LTPHAPHIVKAGAPADDSASGAGAPAILESLAKVLFYRWERLDPIFLGLVPLGWEREIGEWEDLPPEVRAFYADCVATVLRNQDEIKRLFHLTNKDAETNGALSGGE
jgi:hypothetical protein